ncbi:serine protease [Micromonospora sp. PLK6-60]|uniref:VMAP-C domain-containing protein n=1 Tax=Micromonospora sp. PLK6-60 TaxID=2873383 RepID=UPI001CA6F540|nr:trypsin-like peptidase domain-containing protein [Micromonospora sp. PLK6-60]MBY8874667.1 serine protease [Micromonospora sp. PLK6-60]
MTRPHADFIADILRDQCLVLVEGGRTTGSGFFAAPGFVLTCAHVTGAEIGTKVTVSWPGHKASATVRWASRQPTATGTWPYPDLAVVELDEGPYGHGCAFLEQRYPPLKSDVLAIGHSAIYQATPEVEPTVLRYGGLTSYPPEQFLKLESNEIPAGMSGGPVLSLETGAVCGITKSQRLANTSMGGRAVPLKALRCIEKSLYRRLWRAHDRYHAVDTPWLRHVDAIRAAPTSELNVGEERKLRALLADLPVVDAHRLRWNGVAGILAAEPEAPLIDYRDVAEDLSQLYRGDDHSLPLAVAYAADLARDGADAHARALGDWVLAVSHRRGQAAAANRRMAVSPTVPQTVALMAELTPASQDRGLVRLNVWRHLNTGDSVPVHIGRKSLTPERAWGDLRALLPEELQAAGGTASRVRIEIFAPLELMDEHVGGWRLWPRAQWVELGRRYPVVLRDVDRRYDRGVQGMWQVRWDNLAAAPIGDLLTPIVCEEWPHEAYDGLIEGDPMRGALALAASPFGSATRAALDVALPAGVPVVLWQRRQCLKCKAPRTGPCPGADFVRDIAAMLQQTPLQELPERVRALRNDALAPDSTTPCGKDLVLLWDDPYSQPPPMKRPQAPDTDSRE